MFPRRMLSTLSLVALVSLACTPVAPNPTAAPAEPAAPAAKPGSSPAGKTAANPAVPTESKTGLSQQAVADFYKDKTVRIIVGSAPGGSFDTWSRMLSRHMPKYLPGHPTMIVENKPGAGSVLAANAIYSTEPKDGTVIGTAIQLIVLQQAIGAPGVQFDAARFQWLGSAIKTAHVGVVRTDAGINSIQEVIDGKELVVGALPPGSNLHDQPAVIKAALGANFKLVTGYDGQAKIILALQNGEVDAFFPTSDDLSSQIPHLLTGEKPFARPLVVMGSETPDNPFLQGVPAVETLAKTDEARQLLQAVHAPSQMSNPYLVAPEVPKDRVEALRQAFLDTFKDPDFLAEAQKAKLYPNPSSGEQVSKLVNGVLNAPAPVLAKLGEILK